jgi:hypothetical protein
LATDEESEFSLNVGESGASLEIDAGLDLETTLPVSTNDRSGTSSFQEHSAVLSSGEAEDEAEVGSAESSAFVPGPPPIDGDVDLDGCVDFADFQILQTNFSPGTFGKLRTEGDLNGDGQVNFADFQILQVHFGDKLIPEPASLLVWGGLIGLIWCFGGSRRRAR